MLHSHRLITLCLFVLSAAFGDVYAQSGKTLEVANGDVAGLIRAIEVANQEPSDEVTTIRVRGDFQFTETHSLPSIVSNITIRGPARFVGAGADADAGYQPPFMFNEGPEQLFSIEPGATLSLDTLKLKNFSLKRRGRGLIVNDGILHLNQIHIASIWTEVRCLNVGCTPSIPVLQNGVSGELRMDRVLVLNSGFSGGFIATRSGAGVLQNKGSAVVTASQIFLSENSWIAPIVNSGSLDIRSSSFMFQSVGARHIPELLASDSDGSASIGSSILSGFRGGVCERAVSTGFNLTDAQDCNWSSEEDIVGVPAGLVWRRVSANWTVPTDAEIVTFALVPMAASPAVDSVVCDLVARRDMLNRSRAFGADCDRGAVEATKIGLAEGGINGFYVNPEADGNYVYVQQTDFLTLLVWNTFDANGDPAWIFATGQLVNGTSLLADAYVNRTGPIAPDGPGAEAEAESWGTLQLEMTSCLEGNVVFASDDPAFGSGQFPIERLAFVKQLGCVD